MSFNELFDAELLEIEVAGGEEEEKEERREDDLINHQIEFWNQFVFLSTSATRVQFNMHTSSETYIGEIPTPPPEVIV